jgi:arylsulfatase A-like enzyme
MKCLVVVVDACQPAYLGCYGNDWLVTSALDQLAAQSVVFDQHFAVEPEASAVRWNWWTGRWHHTRKRRRPGKTVPLPRLLWQHGIATAFVGDERSASLGRLPRWGWEQVHWIRQCRVPQLEQESPLGGTIQAAVEWLQAHAAWDNWLLWVELASLRPPWHPDEFDAEALEGYPEAELAPQFDPVSGPLPQPDAPPEVQAQQKAELDRLAATYAGIVSGVDQWLGMLVQQLQELKLYDQVLLLVTADAGWPLGEHGIVGDLPAQLHEELIHLPLLVKLPHQEEAGRRVQQLTCSLDLYPTLAEAFGLPVPEGIHGHSVLAAARGQTRHRREYLCCRGQAGLDEEWVLRTHEWFFKLSGCSGSLFIKPEDRWEVNDVVSRYPEVAEHLELTLRRFRETLEQDRPDLAPVLRHELLRLAASP